jgi:hypothetical protein
LSNANLEGALATGNTSFRGSNITGAGMLHHWFYCQEHLSVEEVMIEKLDSSH